MEGGKIGEFMGKETAGLPNWAWVLVIVAGVAATIFLPKLIPGFGGSGSSSSTTSGTTTDPNAGSASDTMGNYQPAGPFAGYTGNALPGTTVNGQTVPILPAGYSYIYDANGNVVGIQSPTTTTAATGTGTGTGSTTGTTTGTGTGSGSGTASSGGSSGTTTPPPPAAKYITVTRWPAPTSTLSGIAAANGVSLQKVEQLNPQIKNPNLIYAGQKVRVS